MPVVHCTYLVRADVISELSYEDGSDRYEYVNFSDSARRAGIPQYLDNRQVYGYISFDQDSSQNSAERIEQARTLLEKDLHAHSDVKSEALQPVFVTQACQVPDRPLLQRSRPKTLIFCTSFAKTREEWDGRYRRWLRAVRSSLLEYDSILIVDDGSPVLPDWQDAELRTNESAEPASAQLLIYHFREHLGRKAVFNFPGWYRSFAYAGRYAYAHGFDKVVHIESDSVLIGSRPQRYVNNATSGWTAMWCVRHGIPESAIQIMGGDAIRRFAEIERTHPHDSLIGREFELQLPFDKVEKRFNGDRYGEYLPIVP